MAIGFTRKSSYKQAQKIFRLNQIENKKTTNPLTRFFVFQGIAFYLYFTGQFFRAVEFAQKSFAASLESGNLFHRLLAQDLLGHCFVQTGEIHLGQDHLQQATQIAREIDNEAFVAATQTSVLLYDAQFARRQKTIIQELQDYLSSTVFADTYSRANVALELARQWTWQGQFLKAESLLDQVAPGIYSSQNHRQEISFNLRSAELAYLRGQDPRARQHLRAAHLCLHREVDKNFELQILDVELKLTQDPVSLEQKQASADLLLKNFGSMISRNMSSRQQGHFEKADEDEMHALLSAIQLRPEKAVELIVETNYLSLLYKVLPLQKGLRTLLLEGSSPQVFLFSADEVRSLSLPAQIRKLLETLASGLVSKEVLVQKLWGYNYDPLRHDALVYASLSTLRKLLGNQADWILTTENGYSLAPDIRILSSHPSSSHSPQRAPAGGSQEIDLNFRQLQALQYLDAEPFLSTKTYSKIFKTTEITANRDLRSLMEKDYVVRSGFGRATRYSKKGTI